MLTLSENWIVEPVFDYEYKTYQVLGYVGDIEKHFSNDRLYPYLSELAKHLELLESYDAQKEALHESLRRELLKIDLDQLNMVRRGVEDESGVLALIDDILSFAKQHFIRGMEHGRERKREALREINISPLGVMSAKNHEGLLLFRTLNSARVYRYTFRLVRRPGSSEAHKDVVTHFLDEVSIGMFPDFSAIKWRYLRRTDAIRLPNAYLIETNTPLPQYETVLPVVKEYLLAAAS